MTLVFFFLRPLLSFLFFVSFQVLITDRNFRRNALDGTLPDLLNNLSALVELYGLTSISSFYFDFLLIRRDLSRNRFEGFATDFLTMPSLQIL
jgi:hypothetical protein